ncbi:hypothetical protein Ahy_A09g042781 isoform D [Arachis hypogaea]|uniref:Uncharacterized protein n=1 Tax=Arachis hypogaea TaxID=3818 RepID=A0A445BGS4_ARAHY|nr:hypothetical protein Ahy_A09g042781 isoform D [Arachis hypogaea]
MATPERSPVGIHPRRWKRGPAA